MLELMALKQLLRNETSPEAASAPYFASTFASTFEVVDGIAEGSRPEVTLERSGQASHLRSLRMMMSPALILNQRMRTILYHTSASQHFYQRMTRSIQD